MIAISLCFIFSSAHVTKAASNLPYILVDESSGDVLKSNMENHRWYPASLTKMMTAWVAFQAIAKGEIKPGSPVVISRQAAKQPPSKMGYKVGTKLRVDTALKITIVKSANDVSRALAEAVAGSEKAFVRRMNEEAQRLGMINSHFANANGLHNKNQYTSARDIAVLVHKIRTEFPQYADWFATSSIQAGKKTYYSYNLLLERFPGTTGMKTGFICASGYNLAATASRNGRNLIAVVLGRQSQSDRAIAAAKLLHEGFSGEAIAENTLKGNLYSENEPNTAQAKNMRPEMCSEAARKARIDLMPNDMKINSKYLEARRATHPPLTIATGGVDAPPSPAFAARKFIPSGKIPVPQKRPQYSLNDVDGASVQLRKGHAVPALKPVELSQ